MDICAPDARRYILIVAILASSLGFIDGSMVAIALPAIRTSLDASLLQAQWVSNAYMLTLTALILAAGAAGDRFGLARVFGAGIALFVLASIFCAMAPTPRFLIVARAVQGIGAALMVPGSLAIISRAYPASERGRAIGLWAAAAAVTSSLGPLIGGLVLTMGGVETWRWIFAINLPLGGMALWLLFRNVQQDPPQPDRGIDWQGAVLATLGLALVSYSLSDVEYGSPVTMGAITMALAGLAVFVGFLFVERSSPHPMMPLRLFRHGGFSSANVVSFCIYFAFSTILFYLPMAVIGAWGVTEIETAAAYAPLSIFIAALSGQAGRFADRYGPSRLMATGSLVLAAGYVALALVMPSQNFWGAVMPAMCLVGIGMGLVVAPLSTAVMTSVDNTATGTASGINNAVTRMAGFLAVAVMGSVIAVTYGATGGEDSFGRASDTAGHVAASNAAFARIAWISAGLATLAALVSIWSQRFDRPKAESALR